MKTIKYILAILMLFPMLLMPGCKTPTKVSSTYAYTTFETECLGVELDGSQTLRAWGKGKNKSDAIEQAKKNAVRDVLFNGINAGSGECNQKPLILEVNAQEKYERYFNNFFSDGGEYLKFVNMKDEKSTSRIKSADLTQENFGVVVRVLRSELRQQLINDNIIKP
jgi:hypothetical protein